MTDKKIEKMTDDEFDDFFAGFVDMFGDDLRDMFPEDEIISRIRKTNKRKKVLLAMRRIKAKPRRYLKQNFII